MDKRLEELWQKLQKEILELEFEGVENLYKPVKYHLVNGGKRFRPLMLLLACEAVGGNMDEARNAAYAVEMFHNFTLLHDDIMDDAPMRRGHPTVFKKFGYNNALLSGDAFIIHAYKFLEKLPANHLMPALKIFNEAAIGVSEGQQMDMDFEKELIIPIPDYMEMIELKTGVLLGAALRIGALIGNADTSVQEAFYLVGVEFGKVFQMDDDILDTYGNEWMFGKYIGGDIVQSKKTYLMLKAIELAKGDQLIELKHWLTATDFKREEKIAEVTRIYNELDIRKHTEDERNRHYKSAMNALNNMNTDHDRLKPLYSLLDILSNRDI